MDTLVHVPTDLELLISAYKLRLVTTAEEVDGVATWGKGQLISRQKEEELLAGAQQYRASPYPYPGLRAFEQREGNLFFGRDQSVSQVRKSLERRRIVVVLGGSGSGKSSLLKAGLMPYLNMRHRIKGRGGSWYSADFRPRTQPLEELADALVDKLILPQLKLNAPGLPEALGLEPGTSGPAARAPLITKLRAEFRSAASRGREALLELVLDIANRRLDEIDQLASRGLRTPGPSLLLLLDQFEEVFRPEVPAEERDHLLNLIVDLHKHVNEASDKGALFLAITMRSEELHRCTEHRGLSEVVNHSLYLLELMDPDDPSDKKDLRRAIVQPARDVFDDWGLKYDDKSQDAPFEEGFCDWLLDGAKAVSHQLEHAPDQLPLLQHALQATWHSAIRRWSNDPRTEGKLEIRRTDLPGQLNPGEGPPDLSACLCHRADKAVDEAIERFNTVTQTDRGDQSAGEPALQAAFRALARRDDRGNWARRFAKKKDILAFLSADQTPELANIKEGQRWKGIKKALRVFILRGYLSGGEGRDYDISHEALIRNWPRFHEWLRDPTEVAYALTRVMQEVDPEQFKRMTSAKRVEAIPFEVSHKVAMAASAKGLPLEWGEEQIAPALLRPSMERRWGKTTAAALREMGRLCAEADVARTWRSARSAGAKLTFVLAVVAAIFAVHQFSEATNLNQTLRAMGSGSLVSAMLSEDWPSGMPERAAVHALDMLTAEAGNLPKRDDVSKTTALAWDSAVRQILGKRYDLKALTEADKTLAEAPDLVCTDGSKQEEISISIGPGQKTLAAKMALVPGTDGQKLRFEPPSGEVTQKFGQRYQTGTRVCVALGAKFLVVSFPNDPRPVFYELTWQQCNNEASCWRISDNYIAAHRGSTGFQGLADNRKFPCVRAIRTGEEYFKFSKMHALKIVLTFEADAAACHGEAKDRQFVASLVPGIFAIQPAPSAALPRLTDCRKPQGRKPTDPALECKPPSTDDPHVNFYAVTDDDGHEQLLLSVEPPIGNKKISAVQRVSIPADVKRVGFDESGDLIIQDASGSLWKLITSLDRLRTVLNGRASYDLGRGQLARELDDSLTDADLARGIR